MSTSHALVAIEVLIEDHKLIQEQLLPIEPSTTQNASQYLTKLLILACVSHYEQTLKETFVRYSNKKSRGQRKHPHRFEYDEKAYSVYKIFSFGRTDNPNDANTLKSTHKFLEPLKFFGDKFQKHIIETVEAQQSLDVSAQAFQEMFSMRNLIAHNSYIQFNNIRGKSFDDIVALHNEALNFVNFFVSKFT